MSEIIKVDLLNQIQTQILRNPFPYIDPRDPPRIKEDHPRGTEFKISEIFSKLVSRPG